MAELQTNKRAKRGNCALSPPLPLISLITGPQSAQVQRNEFQAWEAASLNKFIWAEAAHTCAEATSASTTE